MSELEYQQIAAEEQPGPGALLRAAREAAGMSITDVAQALKLSPRQVEAIESDDYARLSGPTFVRGFIRNYAKLLKLDAAQLMAGLDSKAELPPPELRVPDSEGVRMPTGVERPTKAWTAAALLAVLLLGVAMVLYFDLIDITSLLKLRGEAPPPAVSAPSQSSAQSPAAAQVVQPSSEVVAGASADTAATRPALAPAEVSGAATPNPAARRLVFTFEGDSWVEVRDGTGRIVFSQINPKGTTQVVEGNAPLSLVVGNATAVRLQYNDQPVDLRPHTRVEVARLTIE